MSQSPQAASETPILRIPLVDLARGVALLAMFVFHFAYDLSFFQLIETDVARHPGWSAFARSIAGSFLGLVGISLVLATQRGFNRRSFLRRLVLVVGAALAVTLATRAFMPQNYIFFGILHHIALASVLALPFLRLPVIAVAAAALVSFALPSLVAHPLLDQPWAAFLGFSRAPLRSADFVPLFPWFGCVLTGIAVARLLRPRADGAAWARWRPVSPLARIIAWGGRNSLPVYLLHQPILIGLILLSIRLAGLPPQEERAFLVSCQRSCVAQGSTLEQCGYDCGCAIAALKTENLWEKLTADRLSPTERVRTGEVAGQCFRKP